MSHSWSLCTRYSPCVNLGSVLLERKYRHTALRWTWTRHDPAACLQPLWWPPWLILVWHDTSLVAGAGCYQQWSPPWYCVAVTLLWPSWQLWSSLRRGTCSQWLVGRDAVGLAPAHNPTPPLSHSTTPSGCSWGLALKIGWHQGPPHNQLPPQSLPHVSHAPHNPSHSCSLLVPSVGALQTARMTETQCQPGHTQGAGPYPQTGCGRNVCQCPGHTHPLLLPWGCRVLGSSCPGCCWAGRVCPAPRRRKPFVDLSLLSLLCLLPQTQLRLISAPASVCVCVCDGAFSRCSVAHLQTHYSPIVGGWKNHTLNLLFLEHVPHTLNQPQECPPPSKWSLFTQYLLISYHPELCQC